ncbi:PPE domain-containing protein [Mycobacterium sp.]|uniref:PPE family protein, SVP subgroup n=1 Tax=Mycobacterium sp. TaxID=1785 RepID=UPI0031DF2CA2
MQFAMLPPEINSSRIYSGPGSEPMLAAAAAWSELATELTSAAAAYESVIGELTSGWLGPAATAMAGAAAPHAEWMRTTAGQAEHTAGQARAAAAAFETAFVMTVPPSAIAANRAQLALLVATNFFGQNTAAIAATEAHYGDMWAQDATAMYSYASSSAAASTLTPYTPPAKTTAANGATEQATAVTKAVGVTAGSHVTTAMSSMSAALQNFASTGPSVLGATGAAAAGTAPAALSAPALAVDPALAAALAGLGANLFGAFVIDSVGTFGIDTVGTFGIDAAGIDIALQAANIETGGVYPGWGSTTAAGMAEAVPVGKLSVPPGWAAAAPAYRPVAVTLPTAGAGFLPEASAGASGSVFGEMALAGMAGRGLSATIGPRRSETTPRRPKPPAQQAGPVTSIAAELRALADLRDSGILTDEEFTEQKHRLLDR